LFELRILKKLSQTKDVTALKQCCQNEIEKLGFSGYTFMQQVSGPKSDVETHLITTPAEFQTVYIGEGIFEHDQTLAYAAVNTKPIFQTTINAELAAVRIKTETILKNEFVQNYLHTKGYHEYYNVPFIASTQEGNALFSITAHNTRPEEFRRRTDNVKPHLHVIARAVDYVGTSKFGDLFLGRKEKAKLCPRPLELLTLLATEDLQLKAAFERMGITRSSGDAHVLAIKEAFGVDTLWAAVFKAAQQGLLSR